MRILACLALALPFAACTPGTAGTTDDGQANGALGSTIKTYRQVLVLAREAGLPCDEHAVTAAAIAYAESSFNVHAINHNDDGSTDYGLWQINSVHGLSEAYLFNSTNNAHAMYEISGGGEDWTPWATYTSGAYEDYTQDAWTAWGAHDCE